MVARRHFRTVYRSNRYSLSLWERVRESHAIVSSVLILLSIFRCAANSTLEPAFDAANKLYAENKFAEAAVVYERLCQSNGVSAALLFNLGNAHYKAGHVGQAIAAYRRAEQLAPRDADLRANLQFVRSQVQGPTFRRSFAERAVGWLSLNEWAGLSAGALWVTFGLLALKQFRPALAGSLRLWTRLAAAATVLLGGSLAFSATTQAAGRTIIITAKETTVRITPDDVARSAFTANDGAELRMLDHKGDWFQVTDGDVRRYGWVKQEQVTTLP